MRPGLPVWATPIPPDTHRACECGTRATVRMTVTYLQAPMPRRVIDPDTDNRADLRLLQKRESLARRKPPPAPIVRELRYDLCDVCMVYAMEERDEMSHRDAERLAGQMAAAMMIDESDKERIAA
jgi:hypothetical protein